MCADLFPPLLLVCLDGDAVDVAPNVNTVLDTKEARRRWEARFDQMYIKPYIMEVS